MADSNDWKTPVNGFRAYYDSSTPRPKTVDLRPLEGKTVAFCSKFSPDGWPWLIYSPFAAASPRDEILVRYEKFAADRNTPLDVIWALHALHPWCEATRNSIAKKRLRASHLPPDLVYDVNQTVQLAIWGLILESPDAHIWCLQAGVRFHGWTYKLNDNFCGAAVRDLRRQTLGIKTCQRVACDDDFWRGDLSQAVAKPKVSSIIACEQQIDVSEKLSTFPERTQQILTMRGLGFTLVEAAEQLGITRDAARWAIESWLDELRKSFAPDA